MYMYSLSLYPITYTDSGTYLPAHTIPRYTCTETDTPEDMELKELLPGGDEGTKPDM